MKVETALVVFEDRMPSAWQYKRQYDVVIAFEKLRQEVQATNIPFVSLEKLVGAGSIYEASALFEELSYLKLADDTRITKSLVYDGYELWWMHCDSLYLYFCLPYTQYKNLLNYISGFSDVYFYRTPYKSLFYLYLLAHDSKMHELTEQNLKKQSLPPFGILIQFFLTALFIPILAIVRSRVMLYIGDKFEKDKDYDSRMKFIYKEIRQRKMPFVEFIRSLESWRTVLKHALIRRRPVVYSEAIAFMGRFMSILSGGRYMARQKFFESSFLSIQDHELRFKLLVATHYLRSACDDIWAIRIMKLILRVIGVKSAFITAATERNMHAVLGCKLVGIPTAGILHGAAPKNYVLYDFLPGFDGKKTLSVDNYGLWSNWWKEFYTKNSKAYKPEQLHVSGSMRPLPDANCPMISDTTKKDTLKVLFISEQLCDPGESMPYLLALVDAKDLDLYIKFRPYRDGFENWLKEHEPSILEKIDQAKVMRGDMSEAVSMCDVAVGSHSTAVLEFLLRLKPFVFYNTNKWGDCFELKSFNSAYSFIARTPEELLKLVKESKNIPQDTLKELQERFFGDPYMNGSKWVVDQLEAAVLKGRETK